MLKEEIFGLGVSQAELEVMIASLNESLLSFKRFHLLTLAFTR